MRYANTKNEGVSQINNPSLEFIVQTIYSFYRKSGDLSTAITSAAMELNMDVSEVQSVAEEYNLTDEMSNDPGNSSMLGEEVTIEEEFEIPGTDFILEKGDKIRVI